MNINPLMQGKGSGGGNEFFVLAKYTTSSGALLSGYIMSGGEMRGDGYGGIGDELEMRFENNAYNVYAKVGGTFVVARTYAIMRTVQCAAGDLIYLFKRNELDDGAYSVSKG